MTRRTYAYLIKLLIVCVIAFLLLYWISSLWSNWDYYANILWEQYLHGRKLRLHGWQTC